MTVAVVILAALAGLGLGLYIARPRGLPLGDLAGLLLRLGGASTDEATRAASLAALGAHARVLGFSVWLVDDPDDVEIKVSRRRKGRRRGGKEEQ